MSSLSEVIEEINGIRLQSPIDTVRKRHLEDLADFTKRNTICYYSGYLHSSDHPDISINDKDINGFMSAIYGLDKSKGLDLIIHSPGGDVCATEAIGDYLRSVFGCNLRVFVPQLAMSGGTMLSCIGKEIYMGKHSSIGPIDPQFGGIPAYGVIQEYESAKEEIMKNPESIVFWRPIIEKYPPAFITQCYKAIGLSSDVVKKWLEDGEMFRELPKDKKAATIKKIMKFLNNNKHTKVHSRHISRDKAKEIGLNILNLEDNDRLQELVLTVHHCYMLTFQNTRAVKIIENHDGKCTVSIDES